MEIYFLIGGLLLGSLLGYLVGKLGFNSKLSEVKNEASQHNIILQTRYNELKNEKEQLNQKFENESTQRQDAELQIATLESEYKNLNEKLETERKQLEELEVKFNKEFENIANRILKQNTLEFNQSSTKNLTDVLNPLKEKIKDFEKKVEDTYNQGVKDQSDLKAELKKLA